MAMAMAMMTTTADGDGHGVCDDRKSPSPHYQNNEGHQSTLLHYGLPSPRLLTTLEPRQPCQGSPTNQLICELVTTVAKKMSALQWVVH